MRILFVITRSDLGGAQSVIVNLANYYVAEGHEVIVAAGDGDGKLFEMLHDGVKTERIRSLKRPLSVKDDLRAVWQLRELYRRYRPDVVHLHSSKAGILGRIAFPPRRVVYTVHGFDSIRVAFRKYLPVEKLLQKRCSAIVGVSRYDYDNLLAEGITSNVSYVYNGVPVPHEMPEGQFDRFSAYRRKILCIARLSPQKNHGLFFEVARLMPDTAFLWIGNQHPVQEPFPANVFFLGNIVNAASYIRQADLFFLPSNYEGLPMVIIEALASGVPVVASDVGGIPELLDGHDGFATPNDACVIKDRINRIFSSKTAYDDFSLAASEMYRKSFTVDKMASGYMKIYKRIVNADR